MILFSNYCPDTQTDKHTDNDIQIIHSEPIALLGHRKVVGNNQIEQYSAEACYVSAVTNKIRQLSCREAWASSCYLSVVLNVLEISSEGRGTSERAIKRRVSCFHARPFAQLHTRTTPLLSNASYDNIKLHYCCWHLDWIIGWVE